MVPKFKNLEEAEQYVSTLPFLEVMRAYARTLYEAQQAELPKIVVTEEQYKAVLELFRIKGFQADGSKENKGRPKKGVRSF